MSAATSTGGQESATTRREQVSAAEVIGLIGAGSIGTNVAELATRHGHDVVLSDSRGPHSLADLAFQQIHAPQLTSDSAPAGTARRRALAVFGDDLGARSRVAAPIDAWGFDPLEAGDLAESWRLQRNTPGWDVSDTVAELQDHLAQARRYRDT